MNSNFDPYRIRRERIGLKLDALCERFDQLATDDPERAQILHQIEALNIAYNAEDYAGSNPGAAHITTAPAPRRPLVLSRTEEQTCSS